MDITEIQKPRTGDRVLGCAHAARALAWFLLVGKADGKDAEVGIEVERSDGKHFAASWIAICPSCALRARRTGDFSDVIARDFVLEADVCITPDAKPEAN